MWKQCCLKIPLLTLYQYFGVELSFSVRDISPNIGKDLRETEPSCFQIVLEKKVTSSSQTRFNSEFHKENG